MSDIESAAAGKAANALERLASSPPSGTVPSPEEGTAGETDGDLLDWMGTDASRWAARFRQTALKLGYSDMDEGWLIGWFANAIEYSHDVRRWRAEKASPSPLPEAPTPPSAEAAEDWRRNVDEYQRNVSALNRVTDKQIDAAEAAGVPDWQWVPKEPDEAMSLAGRKAVAAVADRMEAAKQIAVSVIDFWQQVGHHPEHDIYRAMLAACPRRPA